MGISFLRRKSTVPGICPNAQQSGRHKVTAVLGKTISQKKIPPKPGSGTGNKAHRYRLEKASRDRFMKMNTILNITNFFHSAPAL